MPPATHPLRPLLYQRFLTLENAVPQRSTCQFTIIHMYSVRHLVAMRDLLLQPPLFLSSPSWPSYRRIAKPVVQNNRSSPMPYETRPCIGESGRRRRPERISRETVTTTACDWLRGHFEDWDLLTSRSATCIHTMARSLGNRLLPNSIWRKLTHFDVNGGQSSTYVLWYYAFHQSAPSLFAPPTSYQHP
jgi:hypothetical protein